VVTGATISIIEHPDIAQHPAHALPSKAILAPKGGGYPARVSARGTEEPYPVMATLPRA
jgi:hypothetical protein